MNVLFLIISRDYVKLLLCFISQAIALMFLSWEQTSRRWGCSPVGAPPALPLRSCLHERQGRAIVMCSCTSPEWTSMRREWALSSCVSEWQHWASLWQLWSMSCSWGRPGLALGAQASTELAVEPTSQSGSSGHFLWFTSRTEGRGGLMWFLCECVFVSPAWCCLTPCRGPTLGHCLTGVWVDEDPSFNKSVSPFFFLILFIYLAALGLSCSMWI